MKRALRWLKRIVLGSLALAVLVVAVAIVAIHTDWGRDKLKREVESQLEARFPGTRIGSLEGSVFGTVVARNVSLGGIDGKPFITIDRLEIAVALRPLVGKTVRVDAILADGVVVDLGAPPPPAPPSEPSTWEIDLPSVHVTNAKLLTATGDVVDNVEIDAGAVLHGDGGAIDAAAAVTARWRNQRITASAVVRYDGVLSVPLAHATLGDAAVTLAGIRVADPLAIDGAVVAHVPAALARTLADIDLPGDVDIVTTSRRGAMTLDAAVGPTHLRALLHADLVKLAGDIVGGVTDPRGSAGFALTGSMAGARGIVVAGGAYQDITGAGLVAVDIEHAGDTWRLVSGHLAGHGTSKYGAGEASIAASGTLAPQLALTATGSIDGHHIRKELTRVGDIHVAFDAHNVPGMPAAWTVATKVEASAIRSGTIVVPSAAITATATYDETIAIDLGSHRVATADGKVWSGSGGHIAISDTTIAVTDVKTGTAGSSIVASATIGRLDDDIRASVQARDVALAMFDPTLRGTVAGDVKLERKNGSYSGTGSIDARGVIIPGQPTIDGHVGLKLAGRRVIVDGSASTSAGGAHLALDVTGPRDITDIAAWQQLERSALREVKIGVDHVDGTALGATGTYDGELVLSATDARGGLHAGNIATNIGTVDGDLSLAPGTGNTVDVHVTAAVSGIKPATIDATLVLPRHPFDPRSWKLLGRGALQKAVVRAEGIELDRALLARFGANADLSATVGAVITVESGAAAVTVALDVTNVHGPALRAPVDLHLTGTLGGAGLTADAKVRMANVEVTLGATSPLTLDRAIAGGAKGSPIQATLTIPKLSVRELLALAGRTNIVEAGEVGGTVTVGGTFAAPTMHATLSAHDLTLIPTIASKKPPKLEKLDIDARWAANHGEIDVTGFETGGKFLKISGRGTLGQPQSVAASIEALGFDIAPLVAFAPGVLAGARGTFDAALTVRGVDPQTGDVRGKLHVTQGRLPLAPTLGTLRAADIDITIAKQDVKAILSAKLGAGSITGKASATLKNGLPSVADVSLELRKLAPIGAIQPQLDANVAGHFTRTGTNVRGKITITKGKVYVPPEGGDELLSTGTPADMIFVDQGGVIRTKPSRHKAQKPWLITDIEIGKTQVYVDDPNVLFDGVVSGSLTLQVGEGVTLDGKISAERGAVDVLGRRYQLDRAVIAFDDGTFDPRLDVRLVHDFKDLTLTVDIGGKASNPVPRLSSDPATYTQGQLFAFLAGAEPGDDAGATAGDAVAGASLTLFSSRLGRKISKYLPVKLDTLNYEAETTTSSRAVRAGIRLSDRSHILWRQHIEARPDENPGEAVFEFVLRPWALFEATAGERAGGGDLLLRKRW